METEKCEKCGLEAEKGTLIRDSVDASKILCSQCITPVKKPRKPRKKKEPAEDPIASIDLMGAKFMKNPPQAIDPIALQKDAEKWAEECGLRKVIANGPSREDYPRYGFGFVFQIRETSGKERMATARYTCRGERSFWTLDGAVTG